MEQVILDQVVETFYGQFDLVYSHDGGFDGEYDRFFAGQVNGLVGAADPHGVYVNLARLSGGSSVRIVICDVAPPLPEGEWEDVVEVSTTVPDGADVRWWAWAAEDGGPLTIPPGTYRLRVSAMGRDAGEDSEFVDGIVDTYLLQLWIAPSAPDEIIRSTSANASYWHRETGGRR